MKPGYCDNSLNFMGLTHLIGRVCLRAACLMALCACGVARADDTTAVFSHIDGRVMVKKTTSGRVEFPSVGKTLDGGDAVVTGDQAFAELKIGKAGLCRVGRRAVLIAHAGGLRITAGAALVRVPDDAGLRVESARGAVLIGKGLWITQAVDNGGLKLVCLDGPAEAGARGEGAAEAVAAEQRARIRLRPGELVFLKPGGREFGPVVTIYLEELLATSRLVNGFPEPLAEARRLRNLALIQSEQLKGVTNAVVAGARDADGFELAVPKGK